MATQVNARVRLIDIAAKANVSKMTVAHVLHGTGGANVRVSPETAQRVKQIADGMGYQPNKLAQKLAGGKSHTLGVIIDSHAPLTNLQTMQYIERAAASQGYRVMVSQMHDDPDTLVSNYHDLIRHGVDGVICVSHDYPQLGDSHYASLSLERNLVFLGQPQLTHMPYVAIRHDLGIMQAVEHLQKLGRQRIGIHMYTTGSHAMKQRLTGYQQAIQQSDSTQESLIYQTPKLDQPAQLKEQAQSIARDFVIAQKLDAFIASNDLAAGHLIKALKSQGVLVPDDVAIIGQDNREFCECFSPAITTLDHNSQQQAQAIVTLCLNLIQGDVWTKASSPLMVKPTLVVRESA